MQKRGKNFTESAKSLVESMDNKKGHVTLIDSARVRSITVMIMEVPCCMGLLRIAQQAASAAKNKIPVHTIIVSRSGEICKE